MIMKGQLSDRATPCRLGFPVRDRAGQPHDHLTSTETTLSLGDVCTLFGEARRLAPSAVGRAGRRRGGWRGRGRCRADDYPVGSTATWLRTRRNCTNPSRPRRTGRRHEMETTTPTGHTYLSRAPATWPAAPPLATRGSTSCSAPSSGSPPERYRCRRPRLTSDPWQTCCPSCS